MTKKDIQQFFEERESLSKQGVAREADVSRQLIDYIIAGKRSLTDDTAQKLLPVMRKYGWSKNK